MQPSRPLVMGRHAAVSSGHPLASEAGMEMLRAGGNAVDAAVSTLAALAVLKPEACGLGSDAFLQIYDARSSRVFALNGSGPAPEAATPQACAGGLPQRGPRSSTVPGAVGAWAAALERFGTVGLARALEPAIRYAREGMPVSRHFASETARARELVCGDPACAAIFLPAGSPLRPGELLTQADLARSLEAIAAGGAQAFYAGPFADALDADMRRRGGFMRRGDLEAYAPEWKEPLHIRYRGYDVFEQPLVSQGIIVLEALKLLEGFPLGEYGDRGADFVHLHAEAVKLAIADRQERLGDPAFAGDASAELLDDRFIEHRRRAIDLHRACVVPPPAPSPAASDTSYGCAVDAAGNGVSFIQSVFSEWGAAYVVPGTGALMNNRITGFVLDRGHPNVLRPRKRPMHTLNTVIVCKDEALSWLFGTPGAPAQVQSNAQLLTRVVDAGLDPQAAIDAPRSFWSPEGGLMVEAPYGADVIRELERRGHRVTGIGSWASLTGGMEMIHINEHGVREAAADPRREGYALAY